MNYKRIKNDIDRSFKTENEKIIARKYLMILYVMKKIEDLPLHFLLNAVMILIVAVYFVTLKVNPELVLPISYYALGWCLLCFIIQSMLIVYKKIVISKIKKEMFRSSLRRDALLRLARRNPFLISQSPELKEIIRELSHLSY